MFIESQMRSEWVECTADTGTAPPPAPDDGERNDVAELSEKGLAC